MNNLKLKNKNRIKDRTPFEQGVFVAVFVIFVFYAACLLLPIAFGINGSLKASGREFNKNMISLATPPHFDNYIKALSSLKVSKLGFWAMTKNSVIYSVGVTFMGVGASTCVAYAVAKYKFPLRNFLYALAVFIMVIPIYGSLPASYRLLKQLNMMNSWTYLLSTASGFGGNFLIIYAFFSGIPKDYMEAAFIDGANHFKVFLSIMLPMALPSISAIIITSFIGAWNDYSTPLLYLNKMYTLSSGLYMYERAMQYQANEPIYFAGILISLIPIGVLFVLFQDTIMEKVHMGGLKG